MTDHIDTSPAAIAALKSRAEAAETEVARLTAELDALRAAQDALVAAAYEAAAQAVTDDAGEFDHPATHYTFGRLAEKIRALTPADAVAALAAYARDVRIKALQDAAAVCDKNEHVSGWVSRDAINAMIEKE